MLSRIELSKWKQFLPTLLPSCVLLLLSALIFFSVYHEFTFYSVRPFLRVVGRGEWGVQFVSVKKTKREDKDPTSYFIHRLFFLLSFLCLF